MTHIWDALECLVGIFWASANGSGTEMAFKGLRFGRIHGEYIRDLIHG